MSLTSCVNSIKTLFAAALLGLIALVVLPSGAFSAPDVSVSGDLPRDSSVGYFDLTIVIKNVTSTDGPVTINDTNGANDIMKKRLKVKIAGINGGVGLPYDDSNRDQKLYLIPQGGKTEPDTNNNQKITFTVRVNQLSATLATTIKEQTDSTFKVTVEWSLKEDGTGDPSKSSETAIKVNNAAPTDAPAQFSLVSSNKKLSANWTNPATIGFSDGSSKAPPTNVRMFWVEQGAGVTSLDAYEFKDDGKDVATTCTLDTSVASGSDCVSCDSSKKIYLSDAQSNSKVRSRLFQGTSGDTTADLDLSKKYAVFLMYSSIGLKRSACLIEAPTLNYTLTEINGEGEAEHVDLRCFIATAAVGSPLHHHLKGFRWLRDRVLRKTVLGKRLVNTYYHYAPPAAEFVATHPWLQSSVRFALYPFAYALEGAMKLAQ